MSCFNTRVCGAPLSRKVIKERYRGDELTRNYESSDRSRVRPNRHYVS